MVDTPGGDSWVSNAINNLRSKGFDEVTVKTLRMVQRKYAMTFKEFFSDIYALGPKNETQEQKKLYDTIKRIETIESTIDVILSGAASKVSAKEVDKLEVLMRQVQEDLIFFSDPRRLSAPLVKRIQEVSGYQDTSIERIIKDSKLAREQAIKTSRPKSMMANFSPAVNKSFKSIGGELLDQTLGPLSGIARLAGGVVGGLAGSVGNPFGPKKDEAFIGATRTSDDTAESFLGDLGALQGKPGKTAREGGTGGGKAAGWGAESNMKGIFVSALTTFFNGPMITTKWSTKFFEALGVGSGAGETPKKDSGLFGLGELFSNIKNVGDAFKVITGALPGILTALGPFLVIGTAAAAAGAANNMMTNEAIKLDKQRVSSDESGQREFLKANDINRVKQGLPPLHPEWADDRVKAAWASSSSSGTLGSKASPTAKVYGDDVQGQTEKMRDEIEAKGGGHITLAWEEGYDASKAKVKDILPGGKYENKPIPMEETSGGERTQSTREGVPINTVAAEATMAQGKALDKLSATMADVKEEIKKGGKPGGVTFQSGTEAWSSKDPFAGGLLNVGVLDIN